MSLKNLYSKMLHCQQFSTRYTAVRINKLFEQYLSSHWENYGWFLFLGSHHMPTTKSTLFAGRMYNEFSFVCPSSLLTVKSVDLVVAHGGFLSQWKSPRCTVYWNCFTKSVCVPIYVSIYLFKFVHTHMSKISSSKSSKSNLYMQKVKAK